MSDEETAPPTDQDGLTDPASLKAIVHANWTARSAAWDRWSDTIAQLAQRMNAPLLEAADLAPGQNVLDLASGIGEPALDIARRIGETGVVTATDMVPEMLAGARRRAAEAKLANMRFEIVDMEALPFADAAFDRVLCRFGIMFSPSVDVALAEARRVLAPGGRAAYMVWGPRADNTIFEVVQTVGAGFVAPPAPAGGLTQFRFGEAGSLGDLMRAAGFAEVEELELRFAPTPPAGSRFWAPNVEMSFGATLEALSPARRAALDAAIDDAFEAYLDGDVYRITAHARVATGVA